MANPDPKALPERTPAPEREVYTFDQLGELGVLWLINKVVFHPRGFAFALDYADGETEPRGWSINGFDEPVTFALEGSTELDKFNAVEFLLESARLYDRVPLNKEEN